MVTKIQRCHAKPVGTGLAAFPAGEACVMKNQSPSPSVHRRWAGIAWILTSFLVVTASCAWDAQAAGLIYKDNFQGYWIGSDLRGLGGWDGSTNQGTPSQIPITAGVYLESGNVINTRAITEADRIHVVGHRLPAFDASAVTTISIDAYALSDSTNTGWGIGENPVPGEEFATEEGFFSDFRAFWSYGPGGWYFDLRGIAGNIDIHYFLFPTYEDKQVSLKIIIDGPAGLIYGEYNDGTMPFVSPSRAITAEQITALAAIAIYTDRSLPSRNGLEFDNVQVTTTAGTDPWPCGDVNKTGNVSASDALAVLKSSVGQPIVLQCAPPARPLRTGQTTCYNDDGSPLTCLGTTQDGETQFGIARQFIDNNNGTISDTSTGLVWEKLSANENIHGASRTHTWAEALHKIEILNVLQFGEHSDWRLPSVRELETLMNFDVDDEMIAAIFREPCSPGDDIDVASCTTLSYHWTSTTWGGNPAAAWVVNFGTGTVEASMKNVGRHARAVRSDW